ncbi:MAG: hypothetical protein ACYDC6_07610 [Acidobacteriaceae bacterium]
MPLLEIPQSHDHFAFPGCAIGNSQRGRRGTDRTRIRAALTIQGLQNEVLEQIVKRLSLEPSVSAVSWLIECSSADGIDYNDTEQLRMLFG